MLQPCDDLGNRLDQVTLCKYLHVHVRVYVYVWYMCGKFDYNISNQVHVCK